MTLPSAGYHARAVAKGPEGKSKLVKDKILRINLEMLRPGIPKKAIKGFSARNKREPEK